MNLDYLGLKERKKSGLKEMLKEEHKSVMRIKKN